MAKVADLSSLKKLERKKQNQRLLKQPGLVLVIAATLVVLLVFSIYPIMQVLVQTIWDGSGIDFSVIKSTISTKIYWSSFRNSVVLGAIVSVLATTIGFVFAFAVARTALPGKKVFHLFAMLPIVSPPFVIALAVILLFGRSGIISKGLLGIVGANVYGMHSLIFVQTLSLFPLAYLNIKGVLESINTSVEDASRSLGASRWQVFRSVTFPLAIPGVFSAMLIVFIKSVSDFANPQILGGDFSTLSSQAYLQINGMHNTRQGAFIAISILLPSVIAFIIQKYWLSKKSFVSVTGKPTRGSGAIAEKHITLPLFTVCLLLTAVIVLFYGTVVWISFVKTWGVDMSLSLKNYTTAFARGGEHIRGSLLLAIVSTPITAILGMIMAYLVVRKKFPGKKLIQFASLLTFSVPGLVLGIGYILAFNKRPILLTGSAFIIIAALVFRHLSIGVEAGTNSLNQIDSSIEEASANLGADNAATFFKITLPMLKHALQTTLINTFVRSMTSISAVIFLVSVNWNLLTVLIMSEVEASRFGTAAAYCVILMVIVLISFAVMDLVVNKLGNVGKRGASR